MTDIVVTPPAVISITATSPNAYTITATQPDTITITAALGNVGDMTKTVYDTNLNGVVDNSEALGGVAASGFVQTGNASWVDLTDGGSTTLHSHANDHARQHSITSTSDHTSAATSGQMLQADTNGLPVNATNTDAQVAAAVTASHAAVTVSDTASIDLTLTGQQISAAAIFGTTSGVVAEGNHIHASPTLVDPSVVDNFVSFSNTAGAQKDSGKGLTHLVYTLQYGMAANLNPLDATTYYLGGFLSQSTTAALGRIYFPIGGTIISADFCSLVAGTLATNETSSAWLRINNTTDTLISNAITQNAVFARFANTELSISVNAGDYMEIKWTTPTWTTNPTNFRAWGVIMVRV